MGKQRGVWPMGIDGLVEALADVIRDETKEMRLPVNPQEGDYDEPPEPPRAPNVYELNLPKRTDNRPMIPYILVQALEGRDDADEKDKARTAKAELRVLIAFYHEDPQEGDAAVLGLIERLRVRLEEGMLLAEQYMLQMPVDWSLYPDDSGVYHLGEIDLSWSLPAIKKTKYFI